MGRRHPHRGAISPHRVGGPVPQHHRDAALVTLPDRCQLPRGPKPHRAPLHSIDGVERVRERPQDDGAARFGAREHDWAVVAAGRTTQSRQVRPHFRLGPQAVEQREPELGQPRRSDPDRRKPDGRARAGRVAQVQVRKHRETKGRKPSSIVLTARRREQRRRGRCCRRPCDTVLGKGAEGVLPSARGVVRKDEPVGDCAAAAVDPRSPPHSDGAPQAAAPCPRCAKGDAQRWGDPLRGGDNGEGTSSKHYGFTSTPHP